MGKHEKKKRRRSSSSSSSSSSNSSDGAAKQLRREKKELKKAKKRLKKEAKKEKKQARKLEKRALEAAAPPPRANPSPRPAAAAPPPPFSALASVVSPLSTGYTKDRAGASAGAGWSHRNDRPADAAADGRPLTSLARRHRESLAPRDTALEVLAREKDKDRDKRG